MRCPRCGDGEKLRLSHAEGFWEARVLRFFGWFPFRCRGCGHRFHRMGSRLDRARKSKRKRRRPETSDFVPAARPSESFEDVVETLKRAEAARGLEETEEPEASSLRTFRRNG